MPLKYIQRTSEFSLDGYFCSWSCMKTYNMDRNNLHVIGIINSNMLLMRKMLYNKFSNIKRAPPRNRLKMFGGDLTIDEFRSGCDRDPIPIKSITESKVPSITKIIPIQRVSNEKLSEINNSNARNEPLRLKREKPLKREQNNLEGLLGIKRRGTVSTN